MYPRIEIQKVVTTRKVQFGRSETAIVTNEGIYYVLNMFCSFVVSLMYGIPMRLPYGCELFKKS